MLRIIKFGSGEFVRTSSDVGLIGNGGRPRAFVDLLQDLICAAKERGGRKEAPVNSPFLFSQ